MKRIVCRLLAFLVVGLEIAAALALIYFVYPSLPEYWKLVGSLVYIVIVYVPLIGVEDMFREMAKVNTQ